MKTNEIYILLRFLYWLRNVAADFYDNTEVSRLNDRYQVIILKDEKCRPKANMQKWSEVNEVTPHFLQYEYKYSLTYRLFINDGHSEPRYRVWIVTFLWSVSVEGPNALWNFIKLYIILQNKLVPFLKCKSLFGFNVLSLACVSVFLCYGFAHKTFCQRNDELNWTWIYQCCTNHWIDSMFWLEQCYWVMSNHWKGCKNFRFEMFARPQEGTGNKLGYIVMELARLTRNLQETHKKLVTNSQCRIIHHFRKFWVLAQILSFLSEKIPVYYR